LQAEAVQMEANLRHTDGTHSSMTIELQVVICLSGSDISNTSNLNRSAFCTDVASGVLQEWIEHNPARQPGGLVLTFLGMLGRVFDQSVTLCVTQRLGLPWPFANAPPRPRLFARSLTAIPTVCVCFRLNNAYAPIRQLRGRCIVVGVLGTLP